MRGPIGSGVVKHFQWPSVRSRSATMTLLFSVEICCWHCAMPRNEKSSASIQAEEEENKEGVEEEDDDDDG